MSVDLTDFAFNPNRFNVSAGKEIAVKVTNRVANVYEFVIMTAGTKVEPPFGDKDEGCWRTIWSKRAMHAQGGDEGA